MADSVGFPISFFYSAFIVENSLRGDSFRGSVNQGNEVS